MRTLAILFFFILASHSFANTLPLTPTSFSQLPEWRQDDHTKALESFLHSCKKIEKKSSQYLHQDHRFGSAKKWKSLCKKAQSTPAKKSRKFFETHFAPHLAGHETGLFTGYYQIILKASRKKHGAYQYPIYHPPAAVTNKTPYYTRKEIDQGALPDSLAFLWAADPAQLFFLHVQGSGIVELDDGNLISIGFAGRNHHPYTPIGRYMIDQGMIPKEKISAETIKHYLRKHPKQANAIMQQNVSYIFFKEQSTKGAIGAAGVALTPLRSLAIDPTFLPYGVPLYLSTERSADHSPLHKLMVTQDTGSAIKGGVRGDIFFGYGNQAEHWASEQQAKGRYYILLPK